MRRQDRGMKRSRETVDASFSRKQIYSRLSEKNQKKENSRETDRQTLCRLFPNKQVHHVHEGQYERVYTVQRTRASSGEGCVFERNVALVAQCCQEMKLAEEGKSARLHTETLACEIKIWQAARSFFSDSPSSRLGACASYNLEKKVPRTVKNSP